MIKKIKSFIKGIGVFFLFPVLAILWLLGWVIMINSEKKEVVIRYE